MKKRRKYNLTIIIPYYYQLEIINETLAVISSQAKCNERIIELLIVDSKTNSEKIKVNEFNKNNKFINIKIFHTENCVSAKRNKGIRLANSEYIIFLDDDVIPGKGFLEYFLKNQENNLMTSCFVDFEKPRNSYLYYRKRKEKSVIKKILSSKEVNPIYCTTMAFGVRRNLLIENELYFDENFKGYGWEDIDYFIQAHKKGIKLNFAKIFIIHRELKNHKQYFKKQMLMGSWYKYFLIKNPIYAKKIKIHYLYKLISIFRILRPLIDLILKIVEILLKKNLPFNFFTYSIYEFYFKYANLLGMLGEPLKYE